MPDAPMNAAPSDGSVLRLTETDRLAVERLAEGIAEHARMRSEKASVRAEAPEETKRARLERAQERLMAMFEDAVAQPAVDRALQQSGFDAALLRDAGARGTWARDVMSAIKAVRPVIEREQTEQRQQAVRETARAMIEIGIDRNAAGSESWLDALEGRVRDSLGGGKVDDKAVAERLMSWAEEVLIAVPEPAAATARAVLLHHAFAAELGGGEGEALRQGQAAAGYGSVGENVRQRHSPGGQAEPSGSQPNRISASDETESVAAQRQVEDLAARSVGEALSERPRRLREQLRKLFAGREGRTQSGPLAAPPMSEDDLSEVLRRRYAIHVSADRKTVELFETGAKIPSITLDARSISTTHNEGAVIADVVALARDRGWQTLKVAGTPDFKDAIWLEAQKAGLVVQHDPSSAVQATYAKWDCDRQANQVQDATLALGPRLGARDDLARAFAAKTPEERLADPGLRNAQLELVIGMRTAEQELKRSIAEMPDVAQALTAAVREQLASGRIFDAPFVRSSQIKPGARQVINPQIDADRIPPPRH